MEQQQNTEAASRDGPEQEPHLSPRVYVASLSDYNAGILYGAWLNAAVEPEELDEDITRMLQGSPSAAHETVEEWAIHDYEGFGSVRLGEYTPIETVSRIARGIDVHGPAFAAWISLTDETGDDIESRFESAYLGEWSSVEEYADHLPADFELDELLDKAVPESLRPHVQVDVAGFGRDLEIGGDISAQDSPNGVYIFSNYE
jgi:antirestriction protein